MSISIVKKYDNKKFGFVLPRVIIGNRGDLLSRYGIIQILKTISDDICVFCNSEQDLLDLNIPYLKYTKFHNLFMNREQKNVLKKTKIMVWGAGLDIQDESGLFKLLYLILLFTYYKSLDMKVVVLSQGVGPLKSKIGKFLTSVLLKKIDLVVVRDSQSLKLLKDITPQKDIKLSYDGIFLGEIDFTLIEKKEKEYIDNLLCNKMFNIGFNIRLWYHLKNGLLPYQFSQKSSLKRAAPQMKTLIDSSKVLIDNLLTKHNCRVILISAYQYGELPSEDDVMWLEMIDIKNNDNKLILIREKISLSAYLYLMSKLDLMIGARLHSTLAAIRMNTPSVNLNYTLKGKNIFSDMGLSDYVVELDDFIKNPYLVENKAAAILENLDNEKLKFKKISDDITNKNNVIIKTCMQEIMK